MIFNVSKEKPRESLIFEESSDSAFAATWTSNPSTLAHQTFVLDSKPMLNHFERSSKSLTVLLRWAWSSSMRFSLDRDISMTKWPRHAFLESAGMPMFLNHFIVISTII